MFINNPLPRGGFGILREGSPQRSTRDADGVGNAWKTTNQSVPNLAAVQNVLSQHTREINRLRKRIPTFIQQPTTYYPFKIYNIGNASATPTQIATYTAVNADINQFTFQVRSGVIGFRSQYSFIPGTNGTFGIYEQGLECECTDKTLFYDSNPVANVGVSILLSNTADTLIYDDKVAGPLPQAVLNPTYDANGQIYASFYIKLIDDVDGPYSQLWGRMFTGNPLDPTGRPTTALANNTDSSVIPLGIVVFSQSTPSDTGIQQYQWGNLVNRYASEGPLGSPLGPVVVQRGYWKANSLSGQWFYKGDIVIDDSVLWGSVSLAGGSEAVVYLYGIYTYNQSKVQPISSSPSTTPGDWTLTGTLSSPTAL